MKIAFVDLLNLYNDHHGIYALAGVLKSDDRQLFYVGTRSFSRALKNIRTISPDLICYSSFSATIPLYVSFDRLAKQACSARSVIGGPGPTFDWSALEASSIDAICIGEGEYALVDFIRNGFAPAKNIFRRQDDFPDTFYPLVNMDELPFPDRSVVYNADRLLRDSPSKQFFSGRGCPYDCSYCFNHKFREMFQGCGPAIRKKSVDYLMEEIRDVRRRYPLKEVIFNDDIFILGGKWFADFCDHYPRKVGLPYTCNIRANLIDEEIAAGLKQSGCQAVNWAIETGNDRLRNTVLNRNMTDEQIYHAAQCLTRQGIPFRTGNILGLPGETPSQMDETVEMNIRVKPYLGLANIFIPFPGLTLTQYAMEQGCCREPGIHDLPRDYFSNSLLDFSQKEKSRIYKLFCLFPLFVRWPALFHNRGIREGLLALPGIILRPVYELVYTYKMARLCIPRTSLALKMRMAFRHLRNL
jgi:anaerobic magnesium-protoporphyrin IX monomethyl ester cyclase